MASSSSIPSSTSSSTTSTSSSAGPSGRPPPVGSPARVHPELGTRAAVPGTRAAARPPIYPRAAARPPIYPPRGRGRGRQSRGLSLQRRRVVRYTAEGWCSSSAGSASSEYFPSSSTVAPSTTTDTAPASAATLSTLVPIASGSAPAVATSAHTSSSAPGVKKISDPALEPHALSSASTSAPNIADASPSSSAPGVTTIAADPSAPTSAPTIPSLRDNWVAQHWGIVPRPVEPCPVQRQALGGGNGMPPVEVLYPEIPVPLCPWREQDPSPSLGGSWCWVCRKQPPWVVGRPCGHLGICVVCYCNDISNSSRFVCPCCWQFITSWLL